MTTDAQSFFQGWCKGEAANRDLIALKLIYVDMCGGVLTDGVLFSQIMYWHEPNKHGQSRLQVFRDGHRWLAKANNEWFDECRVSERTARDSLSRLEKLGLIEKHLWHFGGKPTVHIRVVPERFKELVEAVENGTIDAIHQQLLFDRKRQIDKKPIRQKTSFDGKRQIATRAIRRKTSNAYTETTYTETTKDSADSPDGDQQGQPINPKTVTEQWGYRVGQNAFWWYDEGQRWVPGQIIRFTQQYAFFETRDKHGNIHVKKRGRTKCSPDGSTKTWTLVSELPPLQQVIALHSYHMAEDQAVNGSRMEELNMHVKDLRERFQNGNAIEPPELNAAYGHHKSQGLSAPKKRGGIGDMAAVYRDSVQAHKPKPPVTFVVWEQCPHCFGIGALIGSDNSTIQCPTCLEHEGESHDRAIA